MLIRCKWADKTEAYDSEITFPSRERIKKSSTKHSSFVGLESLLRLWNRASLELSHQMYFNSKNRHRVDLNIFESRQFSANLHTVLTHFIWNSGENFFTILSKVPRVVHFFWGYPIIFNFCYQLRLNFLSPCSILKRPIKSFSKGWPTSCVLSNNCLSITHVLRWSDDNGKWCIHLWPPEPFRYQNVMLLDWYKTDIFVFSGANLFLKFWEWLTKRRTYSCRLSSQFGERIVQ